MRTDLPETYVVNGDTPDAIMADIARCTPVRDAGLFAANTGYSLSTSYAYAPSSDGLCRVRTAVVALHTNQIFPVWSGRGSDTAKEAWGRFIANLYAHEQGHLDLDKAYAEKIYTGLATTAPGNCATYKMNLDTLVSRLTHELATQNQTYDDTTKHGTTQGAVL